MKPEELQILELEINKYTEGEFEKNLLNSAFKCLLAKDNSLRFNSFATAIRELSRHILTRLAPDENVIKCVWYKSEIKDKPLGITRSQRVKYAVQGGLNDQYILKDLGINTKEPSKQIVNAIEMLNKYTHVNEDTFGLNEEIIDKHVKEVIDAFLNLFKVISTCRKNLINKLEDTIQNTLIEHSLVETFTEIDSLSTHHWIEGIFTHQHKVIGLDDKHIIIKTAGSFNVLQQYGSDGDQRRGDGHQMYNDFPFECELRCNVNQTKCFNPVIESLEIDTDWWDE